MQLAQLTQTIGVCATLLVGQFCALRNSLTTAGGKYQGTKGDATNYGDRLHGFAVLVKELEELIVERA